MWQLNQKFSSEFANSSGAKKRDGGNWEGGPRHIGSLQPPFSVPFAPPDISSFKLCSRF